METRKKKVIRIKWRSFAMLGFVLLFFFSFSMLLKEKIQSSKEITENEKLAEIVHQGLDTPDSESVIQENPLLTLKQRNADFAGWLQYEKAGIDYPVMYTPEDPEFYLHRNFEKEKAKSGQLFIGMNSSIDGSHVVIYGHNMKNGTMFGQLEKLDDLAFVNENPTITLLTLEEEIQYEIFGAFYSRVYTQSETGVFRYYNYPKLDTRELFDEYIQNVYKESLYRRNVDVNYGDQILTLSTCSYNQENGRFVVVARRIDK